MVKKILFHMTFGLAALLGACSVDEQEKFGEAAVGVSAVIEAASHSRAANGQWEVGDAIGISGSGYSNMKYVTDGGYAFMHEGGAASGLFIREPGRVTFRAYYPYTGEENAVPEAVAVNTADQSKSDRLDFLYAEGTSSVVNPTLNLAFRHVMAQLIFHIAPGDGITMDELNAATFSVDKLAHTGLFNPSDGTTSVTGAAVSTRVTVAADAALTKLNGALILLPQDVGGQWFVANLPSVPLYAPLPACDMLPGHAYTFNVVVSRVGVLVSDCSITDWEPVAAESLAPRI